MAEVEYKGIKVGGSKLLLIIPLIGTIVGGLWGGFEAYQRYLEMENKIANFVSPDLSHIDEYMIETSGRFKLIDAEFKSLTSVDKATTAVISEQVNTIKTTTTQQINSIKATIAQLQTDLHDLRMDLNEDISEINNVFEIALEHATYNVDTAVTKINASIDKQEERLAKQDTRNRQSVEDVNKSSSDNVAIIRGLITSSEERRDRVVDRLDAKLAETQVLIDNMIKENRKFVDGLKAELNDKIKKALVNPLLGK